MYRNNPEIFLLTMTILLIEHVRRFHGHLIVQQRIPGFIHPEAASSVILLLLQDRALVLNILNPRIDLVHL